jgi:ribonuclease HII
LLLDDIENQVIGIDEVGRGAFCGPVVSCSILLKKNIMKNNLVLQIKDSKKLSINKRKTLSKFIKEHSTYHIGVASSMEIDEINILRATNLSMIRSYEKFKESKNFIKIDGLKTFSLNEKTTFVKNGDQKSISIAAASIIAKTWRDRLMTLYAKIYPMYGWERNKGYGTFEHRNAIKRFGITKIHRKSFLSNLM